MFIDDQSTFGTYSPTSIVRMILNITRSIDDSWLGRRIIFMLRRLSSMLTGKCIDTELENTHMRLYTCGNVCEKRAIYAPQLFEYYEREFLAKNAGDGCVFIDIGANVGLYSILVGNQYQRFNHTTIHAIEPHPGLYKRLMYNVNLNPKMHIKPHNIAIMDKNSTFQLDADLKNLGQNSITERGTIPVQGYSLLNFIKQEKIKNVTAIKIDVEGNEEKILVPFLLEENQSFFPKILILEKNTNAWHTDLTALIKQCGYTLNSETRMNFVFTLDS